MRFLDRGLSIAWAPALQIQTLLGGPQKAGLAQARQAMRVPKFENHWFRAGNVFLSPYFKIRK